MQVLKNIGSKVTECAKQSRAPIKKYLNRTFNRLMAITVFIACAAAIYYSLPLITNCTAPILLVTSKSMNPTYQQGDILILNNRVSHFEIGDNVLLYIKRYNGLPIIHRVIAITDPGTPDETYLTKGDKYVMDDMSTYENMQWPKRNQIFGKVIFYIPYAGKIVYNALSPMTKWIFAVIYIIVLFFVDRLDKIV